MSVLKKSQKETWKVGFFFSKIVFCISIPNYKRNAYSLCKIQHCRAAASVILLYVIPVTPNDHLVCLWPLGAFLWLTLYCHGEFYFETITCGDVFHSDLWLSCLAWKRLYFLRYLVLSIFKFLTFWLAMHKKVWILRLHNI